MKSVMPDGAVRPLRHDGRWVVTVYHPSYVLRGPDEVSRAQAYAVIVAGLRAALALLDKSGPEA